MLVTIYFTALSVILTCWAVHSWRQRDSPWVVGAIAALAVGNTYSAWVGF